MPERWVSPPLVAREAPSPRRAVWRFRLVALLVLALLVAGTVQLFRVLSGATAQDPGFEAAALHEATPGPLVGSVAHLAAGPGAPAAK